MMEANPSHLVQRGFGFACYDLPVEAGVTLADLLRPEAWASAATRLKKDDTVRVVAKDGSLDVELKVANDPKASGAVPEVQMVPIRVWQAPTSDDGAA